MDDAAVAAFAAQWSPGATGGCRVGVLDPTRGLDQVEDVLLAHAGVGLDTTTLVALDFDQTLTVTRVDDGVKSHSLRGGPDTAAWLDSLRPRGVDAVVVTAAPASLGSASALRSDMSRIGVAPVFDVDDAVGPEDILALTRAAAASLAGPHGPHGPQLALMLIIILTTHRRACDLNRVGASTLVVNDAHDELVFALAAKDGSQWSAPVSIARSTLDPHLQAAWDALDPCVAAAALVGARSDALVPPPGSDAAAQIDPLDRVFVDPGTGLPFASSAAVIDWLVAAFIEQAGLAQSVAAPTLRGLMWPPAVMLATTEGVPVAKSGRLLCARYNKPEAVEAYLQGWRTPVPLSTQCADATPSADAAQVGPINTVVFVDDNSDNVVKMFLHFASKRADHLPELYDPTAPAVIALHYPPPEGGRSESCDPTYTALLAALASTPSTDP